MAVEYEVCVAGTPTECWSDWFPGVRAQCRDEPSGTTRTVLLIPGEDASLLHGVLAQIGSLNMRLLSVKRVERSRP